VCWSRGKDNCAPDHKLTYISQTSAAEEHSHEDTEYAVVRRRWTNRNNGSGENGPGETDSQPPEDHALGGANLNLLRWYHEPNDHQPYNAVGAVRIPANGVADDGSGLCGSVETSKASRRVELGETDKEAKG
jgi:hypothetical protein